MSQHKHIVRTDVITSHADRTLLLPKQKLCRIKLEKVNEHNRLLTQFGATHLIWGLPSHEENPL